MNRRKRKSKHVDFHKGLNGLARELFRPRKTSVRFEFELLQMYRVWMLEDAGLCFHDYGQSFIAAMVSPRWVQDNAGRVQGVEVMP